MSVVAKLRGRIRPRALLAAFFCVLGVALVAAPLALEQAVENVRFTDRLGTVPVEVSLCHNGFSQVDTGVLGSMYWEQTGRFGFGACVRVTDPPEAGSTLSSYVDRQFIQRNAVLINDPDSVAVAYGHAFLREFRNEFLRTEALLTALGLLIVVAVRRNGRPVGDDELPWWGHRLARRLTPWPRVRAVMWPTLLVATALTASTAYAGYAFRDWPGSADVGVIYPLPQVDELSFSSPQTREIAAQVQPFIEKNTERLRQAADQYEDQVAASFAIALGQAGREILPRAGERIVIAEADPQGSFVGTAVRTRIYPALLRALGEKAVVLRTIAGDITSNGTVAEDGFVQREAQGLPGVPTVAVKGDHDSDKTVEQMIDHGMLVPDQETREIAGFRVSVANDPEFKTLFGGSVTNESGTTEQEIGQKLRTEVVDDRSSGIAVFHQAVAAAAYLGIGSLNELDRTVGRETTPYDDGIPDVPPGTVDVGHSHRSIGPFVIWNTDTDKVTWTVVDRLGTSGGAENSPTFNRFSAPLSIPLKPVSIRLQYFDTKTGLQTGYVSITLGTDATAAISARTDVGLPLG
ncbi:MAG: metallophosphoesterase family protein [Propionibacteriales bacterium]|nr:metallophosphoesterase family protein [Propionibacteriales bacterium]